MWKTMSFELDAEAHGAFHASVKPVANEVTQIRHCCCAGDA